MTPEQKPHSRPDIDALRERCLGMPSNVTMAHDFLDVLTYVRSLEEQLEAAQKRLAWYERLQGEASDADFAMPYGTGGNLSESYPARSPDA